jgi:hypothetical protein
MEPPVFTNQNGVLDVMMVAMPEPVSGISFTSPNGGGPIHPTAWVYQVCPRPASGLNCPANHATVSPYGGVRLALQAGDTLKIRYVNRLPKLNPLKSRHETDPGEANLHLNPSNLHTHGVITPARRDFERPNVRRFYLRGRLQFRQRHSHSSDDAPTWSHRDGHC